MEKISREPGTVLSQLPAVMVSCTDANGRPNIITLAWAGVLCSDPPMVGLGIRPSRYSHGIIAKTGEFVVNLPSRKEFDATDFCGVHSGREVDKFAATGLTPVKGELVQAPLIQECPVNLECKVRQIINLGSHDLFIGEVVRVHAPEGDLAEILVDGFAYGNGRYYSLGEIIGYYGCARSKFSGAAR